MIETVIFSDDGIHFKNYPVTPASVFPDGTVFWNKIKEADPDSWPPELRLITGEILFISAEQKEAFAVACLRHKIPIIQREDIWGLLLEPFLDTEFSDSDQQRTLERLQQCGFTKSEIQQIRKRVEKRMFSYNYFVWEWVHLGLLDLFAAHGLTSNRRLRWINSLWRSEAKKKLYWWAMDIANRNM